MISQIDSISVVLMLYTAVCIMWVQIFQFSDTRFFSFQTKIFKLVTDYALCVDAYIKFVVLVNQSIQGINTKLYESIFYTYIFHLLRHSWKFFLRLNIVLSLLGKTQLDILDVSGKGAQSPEHHSSIVSISFVGPHLLQESTLSSPYSSQ